MKVIIIGAGEVGYHIADILSKEKQDVILVDRDEERLKELAETLDVMSLLGSGNSPAILKRAGLGEADIVIAVTDSDETNRVACLLASTQSRVPFKIALIHNLELDEHSDIFDKDRLNISLCINPEREAVKNALDLIEFPGATEVTDFHDGRIKLIGFPVQGGPVTGKPLQQLRETHPDSKMLITSIIRDEMLIEPRGDSVIREGDYFFAVAAAGEAKELLRIFGRKTEPARRVVIMGGGNTGRMLAGALEGKGLAVKIIEERKDRCRFLSERLNSPIVLHGDGTSQDLLLEDNIRDMDIFLAVTDDDHRRRRHGHPARGSRHHLHLPVIHPAGGEDPHGQAGILRMNLQNVFHILGIFVFLIGAAMLPLTLHGVGMVTSISGVAATLGNVGPGLGLVNASSTYRELPAAAKWILSLCMLVGRLEIYTVLVLLVPDFWKK